MKGWDSNDFPIGRNDQLSALEVLQALHE